MVRAKPKGGTLRLRNQIIRAVNNWPLGATLVSGNKMFGRKDVLYHKFHLLIFGVAKDGRAILLFPMLRKGRLPKDVCILLNRWDDNGALVGVCHEIGDAWDLIYQDPKEYKIKARVYEHRRQFGYWEKCSNKRRDDESE